MLIMCAVYITRLAKFLPNQPVSNDSMEAFLGKINSRPSPARRLILQRNKITTRYYALLPNGEPTHSNAQMTALAVGALAGGDFDPACIRLLACGTTSPDQLLPSHASMVHGLLNCGPVEYASFSGACCTGIQALKYGWLSVASGACANAVCTGSERLSAWLRAGKYENEDARLHLLNENGFIAFEKEFLRWMLSDGAGAALLEPASRKGLTLKIEWIEMTSFANRLPACMFAGAIRNADGMLSGWHNFDPETWAETSMMSLQQDVKLLGCHIVELGQEFLNDVVKKRNLDIQSIDYFLPHLSSDFFRGRIQLALEQAGMPIPESKWFTNLSKVGNVGAASPYLMLEELFHSGRLKHGDKLLLMIPESARFGYAYCLLTAEEK